MLKNSFLRPLLFAFFCGNILFSQGTDELFIGDGNVFYVVGDSESLEKVNISALTIESKTKLRLRKNGIYYGAEDDSNAVAFLGVSLVMFENEYVDGKMTGNHVFALTIDFFQFVQIAETEHYTVASVWNKMYLGFSPDMRGAREVIFEKIEDYVDIFSVEFIEDNTF